MFDLITGRARHMPRHPAVTILLSTAAQLAAVGLVAVGSLLVVTDQVPAIPSMMAFVAAAPAPPPPPPPPPPPAPRAAQRAARPAPTTGAPVVPVEAPSRIEPEAGFDSDEEGVAGGVEGGVPEGVLGGIVGGLPDDLPPPPPPPPEVQKGPVRIGGQIKMPALIHRVDPVYPQLAISAHLEGVVILEAIVDEEGRVTSVKVLRSNGVLDRPAMDAVRQWRYSPVILNGRPETFILTVVVSFNLEK